MRLTIALLITALTSEARAGDMVAMKPGLLCASPAALATLTLPDGSSRAANPRFVRSGDTMLKVRGGCVDIPPGLRVTVLEAFKRTATVMADPGDGHGRRRFTIPLVDFAAAEGESQVDRQSATASQKAVAPSGPSPSEQLPASDGVSIFAAPKLTEFDAEFAYYKMNGTTPNFDLYANASPSVQSASTFDREQTRATELANYKDLFARFDPHAARTIRLSAILKTYSPELGGFPLDFDENHYIEIGRPVYGSNYYALRFSNVDAFRTVAQSDALTARSFAERNHLEMQGTGDTSVIVQYAFRLTSIPPEMDDSKMLLEARILGARLYDSDGQRLLYVFPSSPAPSPEDTVLTGTLKVADIQGVRIGLSFDEMRKAVATRYVTVKGSPAVNAVGYYNNWGHDAGNNAKCGDLLILGPDFTNISYQTGGMPTYTDCIGARSSQADNTITEIASQQVLRGVSADDLRSKLRAKYGKPTYVRGDSAQFVWIGRDPAGNGQGQVQIMSTVQAATGPGSAGEIVLTMDARPWVDPNPKPKAVPTAEGGPKL